jgi:hypothetical protein
MLRAIREGGAVNRGITDWNGNPAAPGSGVVTRMRSTRLVVYSGRLDKGPHAGRWRRLAVSDDGVGKTLIGDTEADTRRQMEAEFGGPRSSDL